MTYTIEATSDFEESMKKLSRKNHEFKKAVQNKAKNIIQDPHAFKPMRTPLHGFRRVHIMKSFVILYFIKEKENAIVLAKIQHHDQVYR